MAWQWHETFLLGGRFFPSTGVVTPFLGAGIGLGIQFDDHYYDADEGFAIGLAGGAELGVIFFRNSATQLELGLAWDALWDGFESFDLLYRHQLLVVSLSYRIYYGSLAKADAPFYAWIFCGNDG